MIRTSTGAACTEMARRGVGGHELEPRRGASRAPHARDAQRLEPARRSSGQAAGEQQLRLRHQELDLGIVVAQQEVGAALGLACEALGAAALGAQRANGEIDVERCGRGREFVLEAALVDAGIGRVADDETVRQHRLAGHHAQDHVLERVGIDAQAGDAQ